MITIEELHKLCTDGTIKWTTHTLMRLQERGINPSDIKSCIINGEIIEQYPNDYPYPSCLLSGTSIAGKYIHIVTGVGHGYLWIITAYFPSSEKWNEDFKTRKGLI